MVVSVGKVVDALGTSAPSIARLRPWFRDEQPESWMPLISRWHYFESLLVELIERCRDDYDKGRDRIAMLPLASAALGPPLPHPGSRIFASGGNFAEHAKKMSSQQVSKDAPGKLGEFPPWGFYVIPGTVVGHGMTVVPPRGTQKLDYEAEVAVVFGGRSPAAAGDRFEVWGYTAWNDFSIRDAALGLSRTDHGPLTWSLTKNFRTGNSCGPWMVIGHDLDLKNVRIRSWVNGEPRQDGTTADMIYSFDDTARYISEYLPISAGDMVLSGTPAGTAMEGGIDGPYLSDGDRVEVLVDGVSTLTNTVQLDSE
ncbi:fumarylacetoacetate hydrolase family protein [Nocardia fusca]|uniref:fumarylacetoacetate hydrolase family protein n=1 Tax=Nocardia fusca TaxID=941183 RepID=UPI0037CB56AA